MTFSPEKAIRRTDPEAEQNYLNTERPEEDGYWPNYFDIWIIEPDVRSPFPPELPTWDPRHDQPKPDPDPEKVKLFEKWQEEQEELKQIAIERNKRVSQQLEERKPGEIIERPFSIRFKTGRDAHKDMEMYAGIYDPERFIDRIPEIIIIRNSQAEEIACDRGQNFTLPEAIRTDIFNGLVKTGKLGHEDEVRPIIAVAGKFGLNSYHTNYTLEHGADLLLPDLDTEIIRKLIELVAKIKTNPAYQDQWGALVEKAEFYRKVEGLAMGDRSKVTADTEQELAILNRLLPERKRVKILDVGCGDGRITNRLAQDERIKLTGMDANPTLLKAARAAKQRGVKYIEGDLNDYASHEKIPHESQDAVIYTWHSFLEAFGPGNTLRTLKSAWLALKEGGVLIFDQPTRENPDLADGWYYSKVDEETEYLSYIMTEEEIRFMLRITGFEDVEFVHWQTKPSEIYPEGMKKITVRAKKRFLGKE